MLQEMIVIEDGRSSEMLPPQRTNGDTIYRIVREKYVWILLFVSLIATVLMLDNAMISQSIINNTTQVTRRRTDTSSWNGNVNGSASSLLRGITSPPPFINDTTEVSSHLISTTSNWTGNDNASTSSFARYGSPPTGFPWHRWESPDFDVQAFLQELHTIDRLSLVDELNDPEKPRPKDNGKGCVNITTFFKPVRYINLMPYVVRNGIAFHSKRKETMLNMNRWKEFESVLIDSLRLARHLQRTDLRLAALVTDEFPFIMAAADTPWCNNEGGKKIPIFTWCTIKTCNYTWPVPYYELASNKLASTKDWKTQFSKWNDQYPWEAKLPQALWRGTMTGPNLKNWRNLPRAKLVQKSLNTTTIDAGFAVIGKEVEQEARLHSRVVDRMVQEDYMNYRAIIDLDGNAWSGRFGVILCYNSVVIKVESPDGYQSYFHNELKPWEHYIPVHSNLRDLESAVSFAVSDDNQEVVKTIIENAQSWCEQKLVKYQLAADFMWTLASYVELLNNQNDWPTLWKEDVRAYNLPSMNMQEIPNITANSGFPTGKQGTLL